MDGSITLNCGIKNKLLINKFLIMKNKNNVCSICGKEYEGMGNNAQPINNGRCCSECNRTVVVPFRLKMMFKAIYSNNSR